LHFLNNSDDDSGIVNKKSAAITLQEHCSDWQYAPVYTRCILPIPLY